MRNETIEVRSRIKKTRRLRLGRNVSQTDGSAVASIRISGLYLHDIGFQPDGYVDMTINEDGTLTLKPVSPEQHANEMKEKKRAPQS